MNKKVVALSMAFVMTFSGCLEKKPLIDSEKVGKTALEYMNSKYNQDFELLSCKPSKDFGIEEQESYAKAEVSLNDDKYLVKLILSKDDKSDWEVYWDDYMNTIADPFFKENMDNILQNELDINEFTSNIGTFSGGYSDRFPVLNENDMLKEIADSYATALIYKIDMPESSHYEGMDEDIQKALDPYFPNGIVYVYIDVYSNGCYSRYKEEPEKYHDEKTLFSYDITIKNKPNQNKM
ncbi:MAG: hypothetical protein K2K02_03455 [Ruminococcus sp.]|nr:hypothetical protein [Ruminococcus sp.]